MPWSPTYRRVPDARLDPYRDRLVALYPGGSLVDHVLDLTEHWASQWGGHIWWRRWAPDDELAQPLIQLLGGSDFDSPIQEADVDNEVEQWSRGKFPLFGESLDMVWVSQEEALRVAPEIFGISCCFDNDDRPIWTYPPRRP